MKQISVLMIGLGRIGGKFFEQFSQISDSRIKIVAVSESNMSNGLIDEANDLGIPNYPDFEEAIREFGEEIDIIMDTSNRPELKAQMRKLLQETENNHTVIVPMVVDYLMWYLLPDAEDIPQEHHKNIGY
ncbi:Gfo/Idh/MocA family oxidoreductase [Thiomicrorhabdus indica]|uniref:Gfo/Idh/MocA family oxidoreductase n=1 Tax=Thiomicrorhabdus indica TaxID=2267253 RepID=UPI00102DC6A5|nr:Gfo/Idh/MocA family oxidoreductase [Thiomicrorhabdus indica]